jgi:hypothetical protein
MAVSAACGLDRWWAEIICEGGPADAYRPYCEAGHHSSDVGIDCPDQAAAVRPEGGRTIATSSNSRSNVHSNSADIPTDINTL